MLGALRCTRPAEASGVDSALYQILTMLVIHIGPRADVHCGGGPLPCQAVLVQRPGDAATFSGTGNVRSQSGSDAPAALRFPVDTVDPRDQLEEG